MKRILTTIIFVILCLSRIQAQDKEKIKSYYDEVFKRMDIIKSWLSENQKYTFFEDFKGTGMFFNDEIKLDYKHSEEDMNVYEKEINHYLSQLGVGHISLPKALEYEINEIELFGTWELLLVSPEKDFESYCSYLKIALLPFKEGEAEMYDSDTKQAFEALGEMFDAFSEMASGTKMTEEVSKIRENQKESEGKRYVWSLNKEGRDYSVSIIQKPGGFVFSMSGISSLEEFSVFDF